MQPTELNTILERLADQLDIPRYLADEAVVQYETIGSWLAESADLAALQPEIYPQGSFRLGTPVRPIEREGEFDIDLVCLLNLKKESITQADLKARVGARLREDRALAAILSERRRCWTLNYQAKFHLDVLPVIPDPELRPPAILLTDTELRNWQHSNPIGFSDWFFDRMRPVLEERRRVLAEAAGASIDEIPNWRVRTPLQRSVQILKRHRDLRFSCSDDARPVSIIITTLAAHAYQQERDIADALPSILQRMSQFIERRNGRWWVANPANANENFADRWNEKPERRDAFLGWLDSARADFGVLAVAQSAPQAERVLAERFIGRSSAAILAPPAVPDLAAATHAVVPTWSVVRNFDCRLRASVFLKKGGRRLFPLADQALGKNLWIRFQVATSTPPPFEWYWQVVNTGTEASTANQLRGGFEKGTADGVKWEHTLYRGTHWVEAFVVKRDVCVARSGRVLVKVR